jgi:DNA-directed RNA polymerase specialized sigma24 family protein
MHPGLRVELKKRIRRRFTPAAAPHVDESDLVQDALGAALHNRPLLKRLSPPQRSGWFWGVVARLSAAVARRRSKVVSVVPLDDLEAGRLADVGAEEPVATLATRERVAAVRAALASLPDPWRNVLALRDRHPDDWGAVADACGLSGGAVRALWYRALAGLRERLLASSLFHEDDC